MPGSIFAIGEFDGGGGYFDASASRFAARSSGDRFAHPPTLNTSTPHIAIVNSRPMDPP
jgi:hypothetical protein